MKILQWGLGLLFAVAVLATVVTYLAVYQTGVFQEWFAYLLAADAVLIGLLFFAVGGLLVRQFYAWQRGERGAGLSLRLTFLFWGMSLLPAVLVYSVSFGTVFRGIAPWYDTPLGSAFERGITFGQEIVGHEFQRLEYAARDIAASSRAQSGRLGTYLDDARLLYQLDGIALYDANGARTAAAGRSGGETLAAGIVRRTLQEGRHLRLQEGGAARGVEVAVPLRQAGEVGVLWMARQLPAEIAGGLVEIERGQQEYERLQFLREGLQWSFILTMSLSLALILFALGWFSLWLGRSMTRPLVRLSAAAEAVGGGAFDHRLRETHALEEVSHLNHSFNVMAERLSETHRRAEQRQQALAEISRYKESLIASLTTGVLAFSSDGALSDYNAAAEKFCGIELKTWLERKVQLPPSPLAEALDAAVALYESRGEVPAEQRVSTPDDGGVLLVRAAALPDAAGGGLLVIIDDIFAQLFAERTATWEDAARRFVHEIKNPLTPIQLAAERLQVKLGGRLAAPEDEELLNRLVQTIGDQVHAMRKQVDEFRDHSGKLILDRKPMQLNDLLHRVLPSYEMRVHVQRHLQEPLPQVMGDETALQQVLNNLLGNSMEAFAGREGAEILVTTAAADNWVEMTIEDNGGGVREGMLKRLPEPYITTKPKGTGLGLANVRKIVEAHGGKWGMENGADGLRVRVRLPVAPPPEAVAAAAD